MMKRALSTLALAFLISTANATNLDLSSVPLYLGGSVEPNIMVTLDDSGSMQWEVMPDSKRYYTIYLFPMPSGVYGGTNYANQVPNFDDDNVHNFFERSSHNNALFYNPDVTYIPWSNADGTSMGNADPTAAYYNPANTSLGSLDLTKSQQQYACWFKDTTSLTSAYGAPCYGNYTYWPITYYLYNSGSVTDATSYTKVQITSSTSASTSYTSPGGITRTRDEEIQNFANWFQYYRSRILAARAGIGRAFAKQGSNMRVGFAAINQGKTTIDGVSSDSALIQGVRTFSGTNRTTFFNNLYGRVINNYGTPLRDALFDVGKYFERTDSRGPWGETPGTTSAAAQLSCRQNYNILMTDGYWNGASPGVGNVDNTSGNTISGPNNSDFQYTPVHPYEDAWSNTLADVGMYYWDRDIRPDLTNNVPTNPADPAFWQHVVDFTVGLGVNGTLNPSTDLPGLTDGSIAWPQPSSDSENNIDDLWHTAVNTRGQYFSASNPDAFANALSDILSTISDRTSSASSVALNTGTVSSDSKVYQARFDSGDWSGQLLAYPVQSDGSLGAELWNAADKIPAASSRVIFTYDNTQGQPFEWDKISAAEQTLLGSQPVLDYIRGDQSKEVAQGGSYRTRKTLLGDIVHSSPNYVAKPAEQYPDYWGSGASENTVLYSAFKADHASRQALIYAGANDGMLHAFNADTGKEAFAYVPSAVMATLPDLSKTTYTHKYYVDGDTTVVDAFFNGAWHTVLVGSLGGGGQGIYALDVTDPTAFSNETNAAKKVLWEFTDSNDRDLGYTYGKPSIVRLNNGKWAALFSGGYNNTYDNGNDGTNANDSKTGDAVIYLVDLADGSLIKKFDTDFGASRDPAGLNRPNGIATPSAVDFNDDSTVDAIYAGDLFGNLWKIDVSGNSAGSWDFAYKSGATPEPIFTACFGTTCNGTNIQPITTAPQIIRHPTSSGYLVLFGTGKYVETGDNTTTGQVTQSFYGIWDKADTKLTSFDRSNLLQQKIIKETTSGGYDIRATTDNTIDWKTQDGWYLDLVNTDASNTDNFGERQVSDAIIRNGRVIFTTLLPSDDPCDFGGSGWLMELNAYTGSRLDYSPFDLNNDGLFSTSDFVNVGDLNGTGTDVYLPVSGKKSKVGIIATPRVSNDATGTKEYKYTSGSTGSVEVTTENPGPSFNGRQSWRQLDFLFR